MDDIVRQIAVNLAVPLLMGAVGWLSGRMRGVTAERDRKAAQTAEEREVTMHTMRLLLRFRLTDLHRYYVVEDHPCPASMKQDVEECYQLYHELGGNGSGTQMYREIMACHVA